MSVGPLQGPVQRPGPDRDMGEAFTRIENLERLPPGRWIYVGTYPGDPDTTPDSPPFENSWVNAGGGARRLRFRRNQDWSLDIEGTVTAGTSGTTVTTLNELYRPSEDVEAPGVGGTWVLQDDGQLVFTATEGSECCDTIEAALAAHIADPVGAHAATAISFDGSSVIPADNVQDAIEEVKQEILDHIADAVAAHIASAIEYLGSSLLPFDNVQDALDWLAENGGGDGGGCFGFVLEVPAGTIDGANDTFTLSASPDPAADLLLFKNGLLMEQGVDYTLTGSTIVYDAAQIPETGDNHIAGLPSCSVIAGGVTSLAKSGDTPLTGDVTLTGGIGVTLTQAANDISIASVAGTEMDYVEQTSALTVTATSDATAQAFVTGSSVAYDGSTRVCIEVFAPYGDITPAQALVFNLYDGSTDLGRIANVQSISATGQGGNLSTTIYGRRFLTPSNASHQYSIRAWKTGGTAHAGAGAGGTAAYLPAYIRITRA